MTGLPSALAGWITAADVGIYGFLAIYVLVLIAMGTVLDSSSIMLIVLPLVLADPRPVCSSDLVWFGIITVLAVEIGLLTPPLGLSVYVIKGTLADPEIRLGEIFAGAAPFAFVMLLVLILVVAVPPLATILL